MAASTIVTAAMNLATAGLEYLNTREAKEHINKVAEAQRLILKLESKPYGQQDDAAIVEAYAEYAILLDRATAIIAQARASK